MCEGIVYRTSRRLSRPDSSVKDNENNTFAPCQLKFGFL